jgi:AraC family transcriptional regulator
VMRLYKEFRMMDNVSALTVEGLIFEILGAASRRNDRCTSLAQPRWLRQAKDFIHENATVGVSLINAATLVGVHPTYLARMFRKFYHCSVGDYIRHVRLDYAIRELTKSDKSLAEIASAAGFYDQSHLTHAFKLHTGITPAEFRIMAQAK